MMDPYTKLNIPRDVTPVGIEKAYGDEVAIATEYLEGTELAVELRELEMAYDMLRNPNERERYDRQMATEVPALAFLMALLKPKAAKSLTREQEQALKQLEDKYNKEKTDCEHRYTTRKQNAEQRYNEQGQALNAQHQGRLGSVQNSYDWKVTAAEAQFTKATEGNNDSVTLYQARQTRDIEFHRARQERDVELHRCKQVHDVALYDAKRTRDIELYNVGRERDVAIYQAGERQRIAAYRICNPE